jgi:hypothetical protein
MTVPIARSEAIGTRGDRLGGRIERSRCIFARWR